MNPRLGWRTAALGLSAVFLASCGTAGGEAPSRTVQPGAPGSAGGPVAAGEIAAAGRLPHTEADVRFMQNMILHHAQALEMSRLVPDRTNREDIRLLARRIDRSQGDEIALMESWLRARGEEAPDPGDPDAHGHHGPPHEARDPGDEPRLMAGMLTAAQLVELEAASGAEFDRLFLELMIFHHEGALDMVAELHSNPGAAQDPELFQFASHVDADQRIEIGRMVRMLRADRQGR